MKVFYILIFIFLSFNGKAQINLVPNPGFENFDTCPENPVPNLVSLASNWKNYRGSPDFFNSCVQDSSDALWDVPRNGLGFQQAHSGNGYAGVFTYGANGEEDFREWIGIKLKDSLIVGTKYYIQFYYSCAFDGFYFLSNLTSNKMGILFTMHNNFTNYDTDPLPNRAQVYSNNIVADTLNWVKLEGSFIADSSYKYITIGNMFDNINTDTMSIGSPGLGAFYYIDDIYVGTDSILSNVDENNYDDNMEIFPNPASDKINIKFIGKKNYEILIFDATGKEVLRWFNLTEINTASMEDGIYFVRILDKDEFKYLTYKIIISHN